MAIRLLPFALPRSELNDRVNADANNTNRGLDPCFFESGQLIPRWATAKGVQTEFRRCNEIETLPSMGYSI